MSIYTSADNWIARLQEEKAQLVKTLDIREAALRDLLDAMRSTDPMQAANCRVLEYHQIKEDFAKMESAHAAEVERLTAERDALLRAMVWCRSKYRTLFKEATETVLVVTRNFVKMKHRAEAAEAERDSLKAIVTELSNGLGVSEEHVVSAVKETYGKYHIVEAERDAAVARAERAEAIIYDESMDHRAHGFCDCPLCKFADEIAAAPDHISQPGKKVEYAALAPEPWVGPDGEEEA